METKRNKSNISYTRKSARTLGLAAMLITAFALLAMSAAPASAAAASERSDAANLAETEAIPVMARLTVQALDGDKGGALEGAGILIYDGSGALLEKGLTDKEGIYGTYLSEGAHKVWVGAEGYTDSTNVVEMKLGFDTELVVKLNSMRVPPGQEAGEVSGVDEGARIEEEHLQVYVRDAASQAASRGAIANATVLVVDNTEMVMAKGLTDGAGLFETMLPPGEYKVWVFADGYIEHAQVVQMEGSRATTVKAELKRIARSGPGGPATH